MFLFSIKTGAVLCIWSPNTGKLNALFYTFAEFRPIVNRVAARQSTDLFVANGQFSPYFEPFSILGI